MAELMELQPHCPSDLGLILTDGYFVDRAARSVTVWTPLLQVNNFIFIHVILNLQCFPPFVHVT